MEILFQKQITIQFIQIHLASEGTHLLQIQSVILHDQYSETQRQIRRSLSLGTRHTCPQENRVLLSYNQTKGIFSLLYPSYIVQSESKMSLISRSLKNVHNEDDSKLLVLAQSQFDAEVKLGCLCCHYNLAPHSSQRGLPQPAAPL